MNKQEQIEIKIKEILELLGMDLKNDSIADTPRRVAKMYCKEIFAGAKEEIDEVMSVENSFYQKNQMVMQKKYRVQFILRTSPFTNSRQGPCRLYPRG